MTMKRNRRRSKEAMERTELRSEATRLLKAVQCLQNSLEEKRCQLTSTHTQCDVTLRGDRTYFVTLRILSSRMHLSTEKPNGANTPRENMIISRIPQSTTKQSKRLNRDMKYALGPRAYIFTNISTTNSTSSMRLAPSDEIREEREGLMQLGGGGDTSSSSSSEGCSLTL